MARKELYVRVPEKLYYRLFEEGAFIPISEKYGSINQLDVTQRQRAIALLENQKPIGRVENSEKVVRALNSFQDSSKRTYSAIYFVKRSLREFVKAGKILIEEKPSGELTRPKLAQRINKIREKQGVARGARVKNLNPAAARIARSISSDKKRKLNNFFSTVEIKIARKIGKGKIIPNQLDKLLKRLNPIANQYLKDKKIGLGMLDQSIEFYTRKKMLH